MYNLPLMDELGKRKIPDCGDGNGGDSNDGDGGGDDDWKKGVDRMHAVWEIWFVL